MSENLDWESMCLSLLTLLDKIDVNTKEQSILDISQQRFQIAESHGATVVFSNISTGSEH